MTGGVSDQARAERCSFSFFFFLGWYGVVAGRVCRFPFFFGGGICDGMESEEINCVVEKNQVWVFFCWFIGQ